MLETQFLEEMENRSGRKLRLKINDNRNTMLSVRWEANQTVVSMHRMFLKAPRNIMDDLACYFSKKKRSVSTSVKAYIEEGVRRLDYSSKLKPSQIHTQGHVYNLRKLFDEVNQEYFKGEVKLKITWYGKPRVGRRNKFTFGLYSEPLKLIKIHRHLDNISVPDYVVKFVIYHEILHHIYPSYVDEGGTLRMHDKEFKKKEELFKNFRLAKEWIEENEGMLFGD